MNFCKSFEYRGGILSKIPLYTFLYSPSISLALKGGFKDANSYKIHPNDHISLDASYG
jgi:hypothetical protein